MAVTAPLRAPRWPAVTAVVVVAAYTALLQWAMVNQPYRAWGGLLVGPVLLAVSLPMLRRLTRDDDPWVARALVWALVLKLAASLARYAVAFWLYDGTADANTYDRAGAVLMHFYRSGDFTPDLGKRLVGTGFVMVVTGLVYAVIGHTVIGGYLVYSWLGFWGLYLFYRAFRIAVPDGEHRRYAMLLFFLPSLIFWPSGLGKEAWMTLTLGVTAYGAAKLLTRSRGGWPALLLGLAGTAMVRPHITVIVFAGVFAGMLVRPGARTSTLSPIWRVASIAVMLVLGVVLVQRAQAFFGVDTFNSDTVAAVRDNTVVHTTEGGSSFASPAATSPADLPRAAVSVLFRPFPWEAHNVQALTTALEGSLLLVLIVVWRRRIAQLPRRLLRQPYLVFAVVYSLAFVYVFSAIGNYGILARERVQVFPLVLPLLALPLASRQPTTRPRQGPRPREHAT